VCICAAKLSDKAEEEEKSCTNVIDYEDDDGEGSILIVYNSRDVIGHIFAQTTHVVLPLPQLSCGVGSGT